MPILTFFLLAHHVPLAAIVFGTTFYSLFVFIGEVPTGLFADRYGQKASITIGYFLMVFGYLSIWLFPTVFGLYFAASVQGFADSFLSGSEEALIFESVKRQNTEAYQKLYSRFLSNGQIGFMAATAIAGFVYQYFGASAFAPLIFATAFSTFICGTASLFLSDRRGETHQREGSRLFSMLKESFTLIRKNETIFLLTIGAVLTLAGEYFLLGVYQPYFKVHDVPAVWVGLALSCGTLLNVLATRYVYLLEEYLTLELILLFLNLAIGGGFVLMAVFVHPAFLVGLYVCMNGIFNLKEPIVSDYINSHTPTGIRATVLSGISFIRRFFGIFQGLILGSIVGIFGIEISLFVQGIYLALGALISYYLLVHCGCSYKVTNPEGEMLEFE